MVLTVHQHVQVRRGGFLLVVMALPAFVGCAGPQSPPYSNDEAFGLIEPPAEQPRQEYILEVGDLLEVNLYYSPELNTRVRIRPDGKISLQLVDEVEAAGLTAAQLDAVLTEKYSRVLKDPEVAVIVAETAGQKVYVSGEVGSPGIIDLVPGMTALEAIICARGFRETAELKSVIILSKGASGGPCVRRVNVQELLERNEVTKEMYLRPFDVVYVPKTFIAEADLFVDQYIRRLMPADMNVGFSYMLYRGKQTGSVDTDAPR